MDFNKLKVFGFQRAFTKYKIYDPTKFRYIRHPVYGYLEAPVSSNRREIKYLLNNYQQKQEYEKYMNPKGLRYTITSNFNKVGDTIDFADPKMFLIRSNKNYDKNEIKFMVDENLSKPEIKQIFEKLYRVKTKQINTAILPGRVKNDMSSKTRKYVKTKDNKKAVLKLDIEVDDKYKKLNH